MFQKITIIVCTENVAINDNSPCQVNFSSSQVNPKKHNKNDV